MNYIKVTWTHNLEDEPIEMLSELDPQRNEIRKVERFSSGATTFAGPEGASGNTRLSETPLPSIEEIVRDPQFQACFIGQEVFERSWQAATIATAA